MRIARRLTRSLAAFAAVFRNPDLRRVETAFVAFGMAEWATWVAILVYAYQRGGATAAGIVAVIQLVPAAVFAPFAATLGDRFRRDRVLLASYLAQAAAMAATAAALLAEAPVPLVYGLAAVAATSIAMTRPVHGAILPSLARSPEELTAANVVAGSIESASVLAGPALAGFLLGLEGPGSVFAVVAAGLLVGGLLVAGTRAVPPAGDAEGAGAVLRDAVLGVRDLAAERGARLLVSLVAVKSVVIGALDVLIVAMAISLLELGPSGAGYLSAALGAGGVLGAAAALALVGRRRLSPALAAGLILLGVPVAAIGLLPGTLAAALLLVAGGAGHSLADVAGRTMLQRAVRDEVLSRAFGVLEGLHMASLAVGSIAAPLLVATLGTTGALVAVGTFLPALVVLATRGLHTVDAEVDAPVEGVRLLADIDLFAPLPVPTLERLAARLIPVEAPAGTVVIREGDEGDRFYVIESGRVRVTRAGEPVAVLGPGDHVGEIALLHRVPRTATVAALEPVRLQALERADFLEAVTGHPQSRERAQRVAAARLPEPRETR